MENTNYTVSLTRGVTLAKEHKGNSKTCDFYKTEITLTSVADTYEALMSVAEDLLCKANKIVGVENTDEVGTKVNDTIVVENTTTIVPTTDTNIESTSETNSETVVSTPKRYKYKRKTTV